MRAQGRWGLSEHPLCGGTQVGERISDSEPLVPPSQGQSRLLRARGRTVQRRGALAGTGRPGRTCAEAAQHWPSQVTGDSLSVGTLNRCPIIAPEALSTPPHWSLGLRSFAASGEEGGTAVPEPAAPCTLPAPALGLEVEPQGLETILTSALSQYGRKKQTRREPGTCPSSAARRPDQGTAASLGGERPAGSWRSRELSPCPVQPWVPQAGSERPQNTGGALGPCVPTPLLEALCDLLQMH
uniref:Uncharacterized protein LOC112823004 n=1 Tax=Callorhinus ursinus TaxID=34884 RepID=A0A3Q7NXC8_CALUR|nr:uncharacterized protein LOC112823004 [Callorhinus ursinus]